METRALDSHGCSVLDPFRTGSGPWLGTYFVQYPEIFGIGNKIKTVLVLIHAILLLYPSNHPVGWTGLGWYYHIHK